MVGRRVETNGGGLVAGAGNTDWALSTGIGAIGSARASQARGTGIETQILHFFEIFFWRTPAGVRLPGVGICPASIVQG